MKKMGKNKRMFMKLPFLLKPQPPSSSSSSSSSWPWPTCGNSTKTLSFRAGATAFAAEKFKTTINHLPPPPLLLTNNPSSNDECDESRVVVVEEGEGNESIETVIQGLVKTDRLFFEGGRETGSILEEAANRSTSTDCKEEEDESSAEVVRKVDGVVPLEVEGSVALMEMESRDPFMDFKKSMAEMVEANDGWLKKGSWEGLEELLSWYLRVNRKTNHGYILGAFLDLLVSLNYCDGESDSNLISPPSPVSGLSFTSSSSSSTTCSVTPCLCCNSLEQEEEEDGEVEIS